MALDNISNKKNCKIHSPDDSWRWRKGLWMIWTPVKKTQSQQWVVIGYSEKIEYSISAHPQRPQCQSQHSCAWFGWSTLISVKAIWLWGPNTAFVSNWGVSLGLNGNVLQDRHILNQYQPQWIALEGQEAWGQSDLLYLKCCRGYI